MAFILQTLFKLYHWLISPWLGARCRYTPSCSLYAQQAIQHHGPLKGTWLALKRITSCHPWGGSGYDPVPGTELDCEKSKLEKRDLDP